MTNDSKIDQIVANAIKNRDARERDYRARSLKIHPWVCARCGREFSAENLHDLTVQHKDHNHDNTPPHGSNFMKSERLMTDLGFCPKYDLRSALKEYLDWRRTNNFEE